MADNIVLNPGAAGDTLATFDDSTSEHQKVIIEQFDGSAVTPVAKATPLPVDPQSLTAATTSLDTSASLAPGSSIDLDSAQVSVGTTAKLLGLIIVGSAPLKAVLKTVTNAVESSDLAVIWPNNEPIWMPSKELFTVAHDAGAGLDGFRVTITNLNTGAAATDVYCTFLYDEV